MSEAFRRLFKSLGISGREWAVLLLALLLAFSTWLIHNLSLKYNDYFTVSVKALCNIEGHEYESSDQSQVVARGRATGYNVIKNGLFGTDKVRRVEFQPSVMRHLDGDRFYVTSSDLMEYSHLIFGDEVSVEYYASDTLFFRFSKVEFKKVPVYPVYSLSYKPQYMCVGEFEVYPDSVTIYGDPYRLDNISAVYTQPVKRTDLDADIKGVVGLEKISGVRYSSAEVHYSLDVNRYVEMRTKMTVSTVNVPSDKDVLILPSNVEVLLRCLYPLVTDPSHGLNLYVDYDDYISSLSGKCQVKVAGHLPKGIVSYEIFPPYVECIAGDR